MRRCAALLAVVLAFPWPALGQQPASAPPPSAAAPSVAPPPANPDVALPAQTRTDVARIKRDLAAPTTIRDAAASAPVPTFRVSVSEKVDIWKYWGDNTDVSATVRPSGGAWHQEFLNMVTPDEFKGYGGVLSNGEKLQLAATSLAFAGAMQLIGAGIGKARGALDDRARRKAKEEVQQELEEFYRQHPEARPPAAPVAPAPVP